MPTHDTERPKDRDPQRPRGSLISRRTFIGGGIATVFTLDGLAKSIAGIAYNTLMRRTVDIPGNLRTQDILGNNTLYISVGDSLADAYGGGGGAMAERVADHARRRGFPNAKSKNVAVPGSTIDDIERQINTLGTLPSNLERVLIVWTGHNNPLVEALARDAMRDVFSLMSYKGRRDQIMRQMESDLENRMRRIAQKTKSKSIALILPEPAEYAPRIVKIRRDGSKETVIELTDDSMRTMGIRLGLADLRYEAGKAMVRAAKKLQSEGISIGVTDAKKTIFEHNFTNRDQHPNNTAYEKTASTVSMQLRRRRDIPIG